uniref:Uncharacterized protein n=1 Tax=Oryza australiensis TaxID=4532 RepID=A0A1V1H147_9ORYZ|nr:hypothetical protein [Oryza australiensis]
MGTGGRGAGMTRVRAAMGGRSAGAAQDTARMGTRERGTWRKERRSYIYNLIVCCMG